MPFGLQWSYDRFACLKFSKNNLLKTTILWGMMLGRWASLSISSAQR